MTVGSLLLPESHQQANKKAARRYGNTDLIETFLEESALRNLDIGQRKKSK